MTIEQLREAHRAKPFRPFSIHLADGRSFLVKHPEFLFMPPVPGRTFVVATPDGVFRVLDLLLVTSLDFVRNGRRRRAG